MNIDEIYRQSRRAAILGVASGLALGSIKLGGGWLGHSIALTSDAFHSLGDALVAGVVLAALRWSQMPPDREHPYGHTRAEAVAGSNVALLLALTALGIVWNAVSTLGDPGTEPSSIVLWIAALNVLIKEVLYRYNSRVAHDTGSSSVRATAWDHRFDAFSALSVFVGVLLVRWGGPQFYAADNIAAMVVGLVMLWAGGHLFWKSLQELVDRQAEPELLDHVRREARAVSGVRNVEKLFVRKTGLEYLVDIHVEVDPDIAVREGHAIAHEVKNRLVDRIVQVKDVLVHIEPSWTAPQSAK